MPTGGFTLPPKTLASIDISEAAAAGMKRIVVLDDNTIAVVDDQGNAHPAADLSSAVLKDDLGTPNNPPALDNDGVMRGLVSVRHGTKAEIDAMVLNAGEVGYVTYENRLADVRFGDGETLGGRSLRASWMGFAIIPTTVLNGTINDLRLPAAAEVYRCQPSGFTAPVLTGIDSTAITDGDALQRFIFNNATTNRSMEISHLSTNSLAANRIKCSTGSTITLDVGELVEFVKIAGSTAGWYARKL